MMIVFPVSVRACARNRKVVNLAVHTAETAESLCEKLSIAELKEFIGAYEKQADKIIPCKPQLFCNKDKKQNTKNSAFEI